MSVPYKQPEHKLTMIPGPIEFSDPVLYAMATPSQAHTSPEFVKTFQAVLQNLRKLFKSSDANSQPYVLAGSGTLGWDVAAANLIEKNEKVLVLLTGFFSDSFADCLKVYDADVDVITAPVGDVVPLDQIEAQLKKEKYAAITITHVDTSTSVVSDVGAIAEVVRKISPETLIIVDGVCSIGVEDMEFDKWGVDFALTASQKALGVPAGLSIFYASSRAVEKALAREKESTFFASLKRWTPIMKAYESGSGAYFATPAVQTITALKVSLDEILSETLEDRFSKHEKVSSQFKDEMEKLGMKILPVKRDVAAHGLTAVYFPEGVDGPELLAKLATKGFTVAGGIHKALVGRYFRVGHMGYSVYEGHVGKVSKAISESINELKK
ncbi:PLP-dependent transferase [Metschnikowia bicuspidata var. bicuspidata NRRL YB-4993]|uniref:alanine--glyoxylate transaminase n=1 Tax=Metschnikowia bicuspidata var. bicuspidata NRRL YB-4993 TaxID=869754 RepID=A0A1A0H4W1_9ASCO|nr:PLP-dependent transferase [Metschnikowia bicuspidata var. bicuspidata NRRL YB-4993]OBA18963.1 PLP-dependent transferase [Metschnikowia bicuspidata var. bicuspidata NRRL YB-4993]